MIPSDREIPRSVNEGKPIVTAQERSEAARAFRDLVGYYSFVPAPEKPAASNGRFRLALRRH
jgi:MinD-like ATPase involved in chromosome partitioning or flagellar assembly